MLIYGKDAISEIEDWDWLSSSWRKPSRTDEDESARQPVPVMHWQRDARVLVWLWLTRTTMENTGRSVQLTGERACLLVYCCFQQTSVSVNLNQHGTKLQPKLKLINLSHFSNLHIRIALVTVFFLNRVHFLKNPKFM